MTSQTPTRDQLAATEDLGESPAPDHGAPSWTISSRVLVIFAVVCLVINLALTILLPGGQVFARSGLAKRVLLPLFYCIAGGISLAKVRSGTLPRYPTNIAWRTLFAILIASSALTIIAPRQDMVTTDLAQGVILILGFLSVQRLGALFEGERDDNLLRLLGLLSAIGIFAQYANLSTNPLTALSIPGAFYTFFLLTRHRGRMSARRAILFGGIAAGSVVLVFTRSSSADPLSISVIAQIGACACLLLSSYVKPMTRVAIIATGFLAGTHFAVQTQVWKILIGDYAFTDVTISHRGYETAAVMGSLSEHGISQIFGLGPSGTVSLISSPDARTLQGSGRVLDAVDDVHLLSSYFLLKFGLLGIAWLILFTIYSARLTGFVLNAPTVSPVRMGFLLFLVAGIANSLAAATNLLTNPLVPLCVGFLGATTWRHGLVTTDAGSDTARVQHESRSPAINRY